MFRAFFFGQEVRRNFCLHEPHLHTPANTTLFLRLHSTCVYSCSRTHVRIHAYTRTCARVFRSVPAPVSFSLRLHCFHPFDSPYSHLHHYTLYSGPRSSASTFLPASIYARVIHTPTYICHTPYICFPPPLKCSTPTTKCNRIKKEYRKNFSDILFLIKLRLACYHAKSG